MKFTLALVAGLAAVVRAQDPASVSKFFSDLSNYYSSLQSDPNFISAAGGLITASPEVVQSLQALQTATDLGALTAPPALITALPSPYNSLFMSVYQAEISIASSDGIISDGKLVGSAGAALSSGATAAASALTSAASASASAASDMSTSMTGSMASSMTGSMASSMMSSMSTGSAASAASASARSSSSHAGAAGAAPTGVMAMGAVAGLIGGVAALL